MEFEQLTGRRVCAMMSVVKDGAESELFFQRQNGVDQRWIIPFVQDDDISAAQLASQKFLEIAFEFVELNVEIGIRLLEVVDRVDGALAFVADQIGQRPGTKRLIASDPVPKLAEFASESAQEVSVPVVPVRHPGVGEIADVEASAHAASTSALIKLL